MNSIVYYTNNILPHALWRRCWDQLQDVASGHELIVVSRDPMPCANNIVVGPKMPCLTSMYEQILAGVQAATHDTVYLAEHDVLYPAGYFDAERRGGRCYYNSNVIRMSVDGFYAYEQGRTPVQVLSQGSFARRDLERMARERVKRSRDGHRYTWAEFDELPYEEVQHQFPAIDIRHGANLSGGRRAKAVRMSDPYWGPHADLSAACGLTVQPGDPLRKRIVVYTCVFGQCKDAVAAVTPESGVDYLLFTDFGAKADGWTTTEVRPADASPRRASRHPKLRPDLYFGADWSIYVDARCELKCKPSEILRSCSADADLFVFRHRERKCIMEEAARIVETIAETPKYRSEVLAQVTTYARDGFPCQQGLAECGLLVRRHCPSVSEFGAEWWDAYQRGTERDQLAFPFAAWRSKLRLCYLDGSMSGNPFVRVRPRESEVRK